MLFSYDLRLLVRSHPQSNALQSDTLKRINLYFVEYALSSLMRNKTKNLSIVAIFTLLIFLVSSILLIANSIKYELLSTVETLPDMTITQLKAGRVVEIEESIVEEIVQIAGVNDAIARVWGYYYFENAGANFSIVGMDSYENQYKTTLAQVATLYDSDAMQDSMVIGEGVGKILAQSYYQEYFNFILPNGKLKKMRIAGVFKGATQLESNDMIILSKTNAREIFAMEEGYAIDIVVTVANPTEIPTVVSKIKALIPSSRIVTKEDLRISYANIFNYKSGIFLSLFVVALFAFFMIVHDKSSAMSSNERHEIGVLKALGWRVEDILKERLVEALMVSLFAYIVGVLLALAFVFLANAPLLQNIFVGYSHLRGSFELPFVLDGATLALIFLITIPIYIGATLIPSWQVATIESDEVMR